MTLLTCAAVRRRLAAFHDRELPVGEMIAIETHIQECPPCAKELRELRSVGDALRAAAAPAPSDDWTGLQSGVISRMRAEAHESFGARAHRMFEDMHLVWIGLASTAATFLCGGIVLSMLQFASPERGDSLAAVIAVMSAPLGSDLNPARLDRLPQRAEHGARARTSSLPRSPGRSSKDEVVLPLSVIGHARGSGAGCVRAQQRPRRSRLSTTSWMPSRRAKLQPAQGGGGPVAVSLVWLLAHTTVKGKMSS